MDIYFFLSALDKVSKYMKDIETEDEKRKKIELQLHKIDLEIGTIEKDIEKSIKKRKTTKIGIEIDPALGEYDKILNNYNKLLDGKRKSIDELTQLPKRAFKYLVSYKDSILVAIQKMIDGNVREIGVFNEKNIITYVVNAIDIFYDFLKRGFVGDPKDIPTLPFEQTNVLKILLFKPSHVISYFIDWFSGGYGYSHVAFDIGERKDNKVVIEEAVNGGVQRTYLASYKIQPCSVDLTPYVDQSKVERINDIRLCLKEKIGHPYDYFEILGMTLDIPCLDIKKWEVCSGLGWSCLDELRGKILDKYVSPNESLECLMRVHQGKVFISPNVWAEFFGLPQKGTAGY